MFEPRIRILPMLFQESGISVLSEVVLKKVFALILVALF
jgi:hypothetical protein